MKRLPIYEAHELRDLARERATGLLDLAPEQFEELAVLVDEIVRENENTLKLFIRTMLRGVSSGESALQAVQMLREALEKAATDDGSGVNTRELDVFQQGGVTAGGIFGDAPVATDVTDPAARLRTKQHLAESEQEKVEEPPALSPGAKRRRRLLDKAKET